MQIERLKHILIGFIFGIVILLVFNNQINDFIGLSGDAEVRILAKVSWLAICILIATAVPVGLGKSDTEAA